MFLMQSIRSTLGRTFRRRRALKIKSEEELIEATYWIERPKLRLEVPTSLLRMQGALRYNMAHPFVRGIVFGGHELERFYAERQPRTICELHGVSGNGRVGANLPPWELPWYGRSMRAPPPGELNLDAKHGVSFYGPVSDEKIELELRRLLSTYKAISAHGYDPDAYGDIEGYVINDGKRAAFFVRGGKHRSAVLAALGHEHIQVAFRASFPRMIHAEDALHWPLVRNGMIESTLARQILETYTGD